MTSTALSKVGALKQAVEPMAPELQAVCYKMFTPERIFASLYAAAAKTPDLFEADRKTLYLALMRVARYGLDIGDGIDLVILNKKQGDGWVKTVEAWPDYKGLKALCIRHGLIRGADEYVVHEGETYRYEAGLDPILQHIPLSGDVRRPIVSAYSIIRLPRGEKTFNWLWFPQIEAVRATSRSWSDEALQKASKPTGCPPWYAKKTAFRDWVNRQPKSGLPPVVAEAIGHDDTRPEGVTEDGEIVVTPVAA